MSSPGTVLLSFLAGALYGVGAVCAWTDLRRDLGLRTWPWLLACAGVLVQAGALLWGWAASGRVAVLGGAPGSLGLLALCVGGGYLLLGFRERSPWWPALILPLPAVASFLAGFWGHARAGAGGAAFGAGWTAVHVVPTVAGIAALWSAAVLCAMYLLTERYLRGAVLNQPFRWLPSLEALDRLAREALKLAFVLLSLGLAAGVIRALLYRELGSRWLSDPKVISALATWALVCGVLAAGRQGRFGGRRFAHLTLLAAGLGVFTYIGVDAFLGGRHAGL
jgi:ABC-type uncharacterized transport system permease subunit